MAGESRTTTDHDTIRAWAEERGGKPASVKGTEGSDDPGVLRFDFPGGAGEDSLEHVTWEQFFEKFEAQGLALLYQDEKASGEGSTFFKFVKR